MSAEDSGIVPGEGVRDMASKPGIYYDRSRKEMLKYVPADAGSILDVGCGEGHFSALLRENTKACLWGVEINPKVAEIAGKVLDRVICGDIARITSEIPDHYFDAIFFNDVLEHLVDPYSVLSGIRSKLKPGGVVICSLPNVRFIYVLKSLLLDRDWKYEDYGVLDKTHLRFFTEKSVRDMFEVSGYEVVSLEGINDVQSWKLSLLNVVMIGRLSDTRYQQFACVARPRETEKP